MKSILKSLGAILAGLTAGAILSILCDYIMAAAGLMNMERFIDSPLHIVLIVVLYRFAFNTVGCYLTARLAPSKPMLHAMILGTICLLLSLIGMFFMWDQATPFYHIAIALIALPGAWIGGKLYLLKNK
jgi:hypothetical protein